MTLRVLQDFLQYVFNNLLVQQNCLIRWIQFYKNVCILEMTICKSFVQQAMLRNTSEIFREKIDQLIKRLRLCRNE